LLDQRNTNEKHINIQHRGKLQAEIGPYANQTPRGRDWKRKP